MNYKYKCALQWLFSSFPNGQKLNYLFQKYYSKSLLKENWFDEKFNMAKGHYENFINHNEVKENSFQYYEFGAGWDLIIPIFMGLNGFNVTAIDIRKLVFSELIINSLKNFSERYDKFNLNEIKHQNEKELLQSLKEKCKVDYIAPCDARNTGLEDNSIDFISSTATFEHIPKEDLSLILVESKRILKPGGIISVQIDYRDHWAYFDTSISSYNFLQYSETGWRKYNPSLHFQNRMRHKDHKDLIIQAGFNIVEEHIVSPNERDLNRLRSLKIATEFKDYTIEELSVHESTLVLRKV